MIGVGLVQTMMDANWLLISGTLSETQPFDRYREPPFTILNRLYWTTIETRPSCHPLNIIQARDQLGLGPGPTNYKMHVSPRETSMQSQLQLSTRSIKLLKKESK